MGHRRRPEAEWSHFLLSSLVSEPMVLLTPHLGPALQVPLLQCSTIHPSTVSLVLRHIFTAEPMLAWNSLDGRDVLQARPC